MGRGHVIVDRIEEKCVLVSVIAKGISEIQAQEYIDELEFLAVTAGAISEKKFFQKLEIPNSKTYVGSGKLNEIRDYIKQHSIDIRYLSIHMIVYILCY